MRNKDRDIVECACRLADKLREGPYYMLNGEFSPKVKQEIARMVAHCEEKYEQMTRDRAAEDR